MRRLARIAVGLASAATLACVSVTEVPAGTSATLPSGHGFLVFDLESDGDVERVRFSGAVAAEYLDAGTHLKLLVVPAGTYTWSEIVVPSTRGPRRFRARRRVDFWTFRVRAGVVSYPGRIVLDHEPGYAYRLDGSVINRSALVRERLMEKFPQIMSTHELHYTGHDRDDFLEHLRRAQASRP